MNSMTLNKIAAAVLLAGVVAMTTGFVTRLIHPAAGGGHGEVGGALDRDTVLGRERRGQARRERLTAKSPSVHQPTIADSSLAPDGHHVVSIEAHAAPFAPSA